MKREAKAVEYVCDSCRTSVIKCGSGNLGLPAGWLEFKRGHWMLHNCAGCVRHGEERLLMGDPPG